MADEAGGGNAVAFSLVAAGRQAMCAVPRDLRALTAVRPMPLPPVARTTVQLTTDRCNVAVQVAAGRQVVRACVWGIHTCVPCVHIGRGARSVRSLCLFHRVAQSGKQQRAWAALRRGLAD